MYVLDTDMLTLGKFAVRSAAGILPDGTPFNVPDDVDHPKPIDLLESARNMVVYLQLPTRQPGGVEAAPPELVETVARFSTAEFEATDINFDGYLDLAVKDHSGAKSVGYNYWLFDNGSGRFITNSLSRSLSRLSYADIEINAKIREFKLFLYIGTCEQTKTYRIIKSRLVHTEAEERVCGTKWAKVRIKRRIHGKLRLVRTQYEKY